MISQYSDDNNVKNVQTKNHLSRKSNKKLIICLSILILFEVVFLFSLLYIFSLYYHFYKKNKHEHKDTGNQFYESRIQTFLVLINLVRNQMGHLLCIDRPFYEEKEIKVQNDVKKNINVKDIGEKTICILENKSTDYKTKYDAVSAFGKELSNLYEKYKEIYETYNPPENYATIRNMCIIQIVANILERHEFHFQDTIKIVTNLILFVQYSSNIKQIMEAIVGQYSFVPWIQRTMTNNIENIKNNEAKNQSDTIFNEKLRRVNCCIDNIKKISLNEEKIKKIEEEVMDFTEYIKNIVSNLEKISVTGTSIGLYSALKGKEAPIYLKGEYNGVDKFDYETNIELLDIVLSNESKWTIDKVAAIRNLSIFLEWQVVASSHLTIASYPNRIYDTKKDCFKYVALVQRILEYEKKIDVLIEKLILRYKINQEKKMEKILDLKLELENKNKVYFYNIGISNEESI